MDSTERMETASDYISPVDLTWKRLDADSPHLFSSVSKFDLLLVSDNDDGLVRAITKTVRGDEGLTRDLVNEINAAREVYYIVRQDFSWAPLCITYNTFRRIVALHPALIRFSKFLHAFGCKTKEDERIKDGFLGECIDTAHGGGKHVVCYNFRHAEENGRSRGDPWSLRQAGVCHINDQETQQSIWLLIQQPRAISEQLSEIVLNLGGRYSRQNSIGLHTLFLSTTDQNWHSYIDHIQSTLEEIEEKACFLKIGKGAAHDYNLAFSDSQKLHLSQNKLRRTLLSLELVIEISDSIRSANINQVPIKNGHDVPLNSLSIQTQNHCRRVRSLLDRSHSTAQLLSAALEFRNYEALSRTNQAMYDHLTVLRALSFKTQQEQSLLSQLAIQGQKDSKSVKALTLIATMYLPMSMLAQVFSSNLIQLQKDGDGSLKQMHFVVVPQFWIFCLVTAMLMALTWAIKALLERNRR